MLVAISSDEGPSVEVIMGIITTTNLQIPVFSRIIKVLPRISFEIEYSRGEFLPYCWNLVYLNSGMYWNRPLLLDFIEGDDAFYI